MRIDGRIPGYLFSAFACLMFTPATLGAQVRTLEWCNKAIAMPCSVSGRLTSRHVYGPPWFGEKKGDKPRFTIYVIRLQASVHIACIRDHAYDPVKDCGTTTSLQIYARDPFATEGRLRHLIGSEVVATGTTSEPVAPMDQTPGIMDLISLEPKNNPQPNDH